MWPKGLSLNGTFDSLPSSNLSDIINEWKEKASNRSRNSNSKAELSFNVTDTEEGDSQKVVGTLKISKKRKKKKKDSEKKTDVSTCDSANCTGVVKGNQAVIINNKLFAANGKLKEDSDNLKTIVNLANQQKGGVGCQIQGGGAGSQVNIYSPKTYTQGKTVTQVTIKKKSRKKLSEVDEEDEEDRVCTEDDWDIEDIGGGVFGNSKFIFNLSKFYSPSNTPL